MDDYPVWSGYTGIARNYLDDPTFECYRFREVYYLKKEDVIKYFNISEIRYKMLARDRYLKVFKDFVEEESFFKLYKIYQEYTKIRTKRQTCVFPHLKYLKEKYKKGTLK
jgi:hypothetical protein